MRKLFNLFKDRRSPEERERDAIRKAVEDYKHNDDLMLSHTVKPWYYGNKLCTTVIDHKPEERRIFH